METSTHNDHLRDWDYIPQFLPKPEADRLYEAMESFPWLAEDEGKFAVHYDKSYSASGGPRKIEHETNPILLPLADRVSKEARARTNYIQCHRMDENAVVRPHRDPKDMTVPMLTLGQARTFRVGGSMPQGMRQNQRKLESHIPDEEIVMKHGDLLIFTGGQVGHSMFAAMDDPSFDPGGFKWRYSLLFRWTTDVMRQHGPSRAAKSAEHRRQYKECRFL